MPESNTPPTEVAGREAPTVEGLMLLVRVFQVAVIQGTMPGGSIKPALSEYESIRSYAERMAGYRGAAAPCAGTYAGCAPECGPHNRCSPEHFDRADVEAVADCLGDDAAQLREENDEDERAANMDRAASMLTWMLLTHPAYAPPPGAGAKADQPNAAAKEKTNG